MLGRERHEVPIRLTLSHRAPSPLLLRDVRVLDYGVNDFSRRASLFIDRGRIRWIGDEGEHEVPSETRVLNAEGRFAIPGLFDMHVHVFPSTHAAHLDAFLAFGVTSVRDPGGGTLSSMKALLDRGQTTNAPVPRFFFSGQYFRGASGRTASTLLIHDEAEARHYVRRWKEQGAQCIKAYSMLPWPLKRVIVDEARRLGLPVVGHGIAVEEITKSVT